MPQSFRIRSRHFETLESRCVPAAAVIGAGFGGDGWDFVDGDADTQSQTNHGVEVASVFRRVAPDAALIDLKVATDDGRVRTGAIENALRWTIDHAAQRDIDVVSMSLGAGNYVDELPQWSSLFEDELAELAQLGVVVVASAGNSYAGAAGLAYPAASANVLAVMELGADVDGLASTSQRSDAALAAPSTKAGTSFSAPYVAAAVQKVADSLGADATREAVIDRLWATAGRTKGGYRQIDLDAALAAPREADVAAPVIASSAERRENVAEAAELTSPDLVVASGVGGVSTSTSTGTSASTST
ncbi:MAG: S8 family serine peptidase, partial [Planctomycetales bacterium]|nr:S8 family serine peptidase [Planctomycetales bacterium]